VTSLVRLLLDGAVAGCAALLVLAGVGKVYRSRRVVEETAIQRALRLRAGPWRRLLIAVGVVELLTGAAVLVRFHPLVTGIAMAAHGVVFSATLAYVRYAKIPGACGCVLSSAEQRVTWRDLARAIVVGPIDRVVRTGARPAP
jgi:Methylamine utilisation protein MauE